tara:strand:- start:1785 stop:4220 length:2436 start_codon:yes stop_codon:yes gene_type:complete
VETVKDTKNSSGLSEFFSVLTKEKAEVRQKIKEKIDDPESGISGLFLQLEEALQETKNVSVEEDFDNTKLSVDDQNKLEVFSNLLNSFGSDKEIPIKKVEPTDFVEELEPEEIIPEELIPEELVVETEESQEIIEPQNDIITSVIRNLEDMSRKTQVKEEVEQISSIRKEFDNFRSLIGQQIASLQMSGAGSGEVRLEFLDDIDRDSVKSDGKALVYDSSDGKWKGESVLSGAITGLDIDGATDIGAALADADLIIVDDGAGGTNRKATLSRLKTYIGAGAADDLGAGDAAVTLTTTSGDITIDAAANNSDIILKGTDGGADTTFLTIDGSAAGAATFNDKVVATELDISGDADIDGTLEADAYTVDGTALNEYIADTVGAMVSSNTETDITVTYQDGDNTIDFVVGTLNQDTTGTAATVTTAAQPNITSLGTLTTLTVDNIIINAANIGHTSDTDSIAIASDGVVTFSQVPVFPNDTVETADIQDNAVTLAKMAGLARGKIIYGDSSGDPAALAVGTNEYVLTSDGTDISWAEVSASSLAADNLSAGDAAVTLTTSSGNITIDAAANNTNIIFKGTDGGSDITMLTLDGSAAGAATFNDKIVATELDISGDVDVDGTLEADAYTVDGTTLAEYIADTAGAMVSSNTETGIAVTYQDGDNTIDFAVDAAQTAITSIYNSSLAIGYGSSHANIDFGTDNRIVFDIDGTSQVLVLDGVFRPTTDSDVDLGSSAKYWKDAYIDTITTTGTITGSSQISADSFNLPITLNGTDGSSTDAGDNIVQNTAANENDRIVYEDATPTHSERPITWDRTT